MENKDSNNANDWALPEGDESARAGSSSGPDETTTFPPVGSEPHLSTEGDGRWGHSAGSSIPSSNNENTKKKSVSRGCLYGVIGALVLLVILGVALLFYVMKLDKELNANPGADSSSGVTTTSTITSTSAAPSTKTTTKTMTTTQPSSSAPSSAAKTEAEESSAKDVGGCDPSDFPPMLGSKVSVVECTGKWAFVGVPNSDVLSVERWQDGKWVGIEPDSEGKQPPQLPCFSADFIQNQGVPKSIASRVECKD